MESILIFGLILLAIGIYIAFLMIVGSLKGFGSLIKYFFDHLNRPNSKLGKYVLPIQEFWRKDKETLHQKALTMISLALGFIILGLTIISQGFKPPEPLQKISHSKTEQKESPPGPQRELATSSNESLAQKTDCGYVQKMLEKYFEYSNAKFIHQLHGFYAQRLERAYISENISSYDVVQALSDYTKDLSIFESIINWNTFQVTAEDYGCKANFEQELVQKKGEEEVQKTKLSSEFRFDMDKKIFYFRDKLRGNSEQD